jgi:hypothetical protein
MPLLIYVVVYDPKFRPAAGEESLIGGDDLLRLSPVPAHELMVAVARD